MPDHLEYGALSRIAHIARDLVVSVANADDLSSAPRHGRGADTLGPTR